MSAQNIVMALFPNTKAQRCARHEMPWPAFCEWLHGLPESPKDQSPLVKLATFGNKRSTKNAIRHDGNVELVHGIEGDYDDEKMTPEAALELLERHHIRAVIVTTHRHRPDAPRWRVFAPLANPVRPDERLRLVEALNGMLGGILAAESGSVSQSFYVGRPPGGEYLVLPTFDDPDEGAYLDQLDDLDALRKPLKAENTANGGVTTEGGYPDYLAQLLAGEKVHNNARAVVACMMNDGMTDATIMGVFQALAISVAQERGTDRAAELLDELPDIITWCRAKRGPEVDVRPMIEQARRELRADPAKEPRTATPPARVGFDDFRAYLPMHNYIFIPTRELWPPSSVNAKLPAVKIPGAKRKMPPAEWLDKNRAVEQMTWAPGEPMLIANRLVSNGGWIDRQGVVCFNLYRPPERAPGNPVDVAPWRDHLRRIYPDSADHIERWFAHRIQRPGEKVNHALVLGGRQGIGKDTLLEPLKYGVGPWNFEDVSPAQLLGRFNGFVKSVVLRVSEARDLGDTDRYGFYEHTKVYTAAPPDVLRCDEKNVREYSVMNVCGVIITTNNKINGIFLPADDRRHYVAWSDLGKDDFRPAYWSGLWAWYAAGGLRNVAAYLAELDLAGFDPKAPPPKTAAFFEIVDANRAPEDAPLADALDKLGRPQALTIGMIADRADTDLANYLTDRRNSRIVPHRLEEAEYVAVRNPGAKDGLWKIDGRRQVVYAFQALPLRERVSAALALSDRRGR